MVDYFKAKVKSSPQTKSFFHNANIDWDKYEEKEVLIKRTGSLEKRVFAEYKNLRFALYESGILTIDGSLHKYANEGTHNYDLFSYSRLIDTINDLEVKFGINPTDVKLENLEIGVNISTHFSSSKIVESIVLHKNKESKYVSIENSEYK